MILTPIAISFLQTPGGVEAAWVDDNFSYRNAIPITSHTAAENNVYITATIDTSASGQFQADCGDLRFTTVGGDILPYYIVSGCVSASTVVHVFFKSMPAGAQTIYYYYGNPSASNGFSSADFATLASSYAVGTVASQEKGGAPIAYWKFDDGTGTQAKDSSSNASNGSLTNSPTWQTEDQCVSGKCLYFNKTGSQFVSVTDPSNGSLDFGTGSYSVSLWLKAPPTQVGTEDVLGKGPWNARYWIYTDTNGYINANFYFGGLDAYITTTKNVRDNKWHHITYVVNRANNEYIYVDGIQIASANVSSASSEDHSSSGALEIGRAYGHNYLKGFVDDVKVYPYARTAAQIKSDFKSRGTAKGSSVSLSSRAGVEGSLSNGLVGYWKMDESAANSCTGGVNDSCDASGNSNDGAWNGDATSAAGKYGNGTTFDGTGDYINIGDPASGILDFGANQDFTLSSWFYLDSLPSAWKGIINKGASGNDGYSMDISSSNYFTCSIDAAGGTNQHVSASSSPATGTWLHGVCVFDRDGNVTGYINGTQVLQGNITGNSATLVNSSNLTLGSYTNGTEWFLAGDLDEVRIYNRALSPREVRDLYAFAPGPVGYWNFDEKSGTTTNDSSGNGNTGTFASGANAPTWTEGKYGSAISTINGTQYTNIANESNFDFINDFTVSTWVYVDPSNGTGYLGALGKYDASSSGWDFGVQSNGVRMTLRGTSNLDTGAIGTLGTGVWRHVSFVNSPTSIKTYIDGVLINTTSGTWTSTTNNIAVTLGNRGTSAYSSGFKGKLDDVRIYNYARTQKQIVEDMNAGHPAGGSPVGSQVGYWRFDEGYAGNVYDSSSQNQNGTITGATWNNNGKFGKTLSFDGLDDVVTVVDSTVLDSVSSAFTISAWVYDSDVDDGTDDDRNIADKGDTGTNVNNTFRFRVNDSKKLQLDIGDGSALNTITGSTTIPHQTWTYVTGVFDGSQIKIYVNGKSDATPVAKTIGTLINAGNLAVGRQSSADCGSPYNSCWKGMIDEVKIYSSALTEDEIKLDYNRGQALVLGNTGEASSSAGTSYCVPGDASTCTPPVASWSLDEKSGVTANDISGTDNSGTIGGSTWKSGGCKTGACLSLNGTTSDYIIKNPTNNFPTTALTVEYWMKSSDTTKDGTGFSYAVTGSDNEFIIYNYRSIDIYANSTSVATSISANDGNWHHIAVTWQSSDGAVKLYKDGRQAYSGTLSSGTALTAGGSMVIGQEQDSVGGNFDAAQAFLGNIDQFAVFNYIRTPAQIAYDYNRGGPVGHWRMDECQGVLAKNSADPANGGAGLNGTITIGATGTQTAVGTCTTSGTAWYNGVTGKMNSSLNFDGTDDYVQVSTNTTLHPDYFTISAWVKPSQYCSDTNVGCVVAGNYASSQDFIFYISDTGKISLRPHPGTDRKGGTSIPLNTWSHVTATYDGSNTKIYFNGVYDGGGSSSGMTHNTNPFVIGKASWSSANYFTGQIDDVRIYNYALTATQVKTLFNGGAAVKFGPVTGSP